MSTADFILFDRGSHRISGSLLVNLKQKKGIKIKDLNIGAGRVAGPGTFAASSKGFLNRGDKVASSNDSTGR